MDTFLYEIFEEIFSKNKDYYLVKYKKLISFEDGYGDVYFDLFDIDFNKYILTRLNNETYKNIVDDDIYYEEYKGIYGLVKYCLHPKHKIEKLRKLELIN